MLTIIKLRDLFSDLSGRGMAQVFADWESLLGLQARSSADAIRIAGGVEELAGLVERPHTVVETQVQRGGQDLGQVYFVFPNSFVLELIAEVLMTSDGAKQARAAARLSETDAATFREMADLLCGSWNRVFEDLERDLRMSRSDGELFVRPGEPSKDVLADAASGGRLAYVPLDVEVNGSTYEALFAVPFEVAVGIAEEFHAA